MKQKRNLRNGKRRLMKELDLFTVLLQFTFRTIKLFSTWEVIHYRQDSSTCNTVPLLPNHVPNMRRNHEMFPKMKVMHLQGALKIDWDLHVLSVPPSTVRRCPTSFRGETVSYNSKEVEALLQVFQMLSALKMCCMPKQNLKYFIS